MVRDWSFMDEAFGRRDYNPDDRGTFTPNTVFVIMAFNPDMDETFQTIQDSCASLKLSARRADDSPGSGIVLSQITRHIEDAEFLIVDLTHERPNVYYELGYAHGVGNVSADILLVAKAGTILHFDIAPFRVRYYSSTTELDDIVRRSLKEMIRSTRRK